MLTGLQGDSSYLDSLVLQGLHWSCEVENHIFGLMAGTICLLVDNISPYMQCSNVCVC